MIGASNRQIFSFCPLALWLLSLAPGAQADDCPQQYFLSVKVEGLSSCERQHLLSLGAGFATPSISTTFGENPAGLIYNRSLNLLASVVQTDSNNSSRHTDIATTLGNGKLGGGVFYQDREDAVGTTVVNQGVRTKILSLGTAALVKSAESAIGIRYNKIVGQRWFGSVTNPLPSGTLDIGWIANAKGNFRAGFNIFDVFSGNRVYGAGIATFFGSNGAFALDGSVKQDGSGGVIRPALGWAYSVFQFGLGYGTNVSGDGQRAWIPTGTNLSLGVMLGKTFQIVYHSRRIEHQYLGISIKF